MPVRSSPPLAKRPTHGESLVVGHRPGLIDDPPAADDIRVVGSSGRLEEAGINVLNLIP